MLQRGTSTSCSDHLPSLKFCRKHMERKGGALVSNPRTKEWIYIYMYLPGLLDFSREEALFAVKRPAYLLPLLPSPRPHPSLTPLQQWERPAADLSWAELRIEWSQLTSSAARELWGIPRASQSKQASQPEAKLSCTQAMGKSITLRDNPRWLPICEPFVRHTPRHRSCTVPEITALLLGRQGFC